MSKPVQTVAERESDVADVKLLAREISVDRPMSPQQAANLFNQQLWCWGRDIEASKGNLLVRHGFQRIEKPRGSSASSIYRLESSPTSRVILRGFGVFFGDDRWGGLFLPRFEFKPQLSPEPDLTRPAWSTEDLPPLTSPRADQLALCQNLLLSLIDWIRRYELWIAEHVGTAYRNRTLIPWKTNHESVVPAEETAAAWELLGVTIEERPEHFIRCLESRSESAA